MSSQIVESTSTSLPKTSGIGTVLRYTGIPVSWLGKRPKLPSRNWLIFLSITSSVVGYYAYDRQQCKQIRKSYVEKVKSLAEEYVHPLDFPRKVMVYGSKWPGDEDYEQSLKYFRKYVKPIFVAAAVDYEMVAGKKQGDIARRIAEDVRMRRRFDSGSEEDSDAKKALPTYEPLKDVRRRELEGGIVIIGRPTFKEFMAGLKEGWTRGLDKPDEDEILARILEDHHFDEQDDSEPIVRNPPALPQSPLFSSLLSQSTSVSTEQNRQSPEPEVFMPGTISPVPPLLFVPFRNRIGFTQIPLMIWDWFNQRYRVQSGAELGYQLVMKNTRPIQVSFDDTTASFADDLSRHPSKHNDLDFDLEAEQLYKRSLSAIPEEIEKVRQEYYKNLPAKLATARALARGTREPTKAEMDNPPPTEVELRAERMKKERRWRSDVEGWNLIKPSTPVAWDERFGNVLRVFMNPPKHTG